MTKFPVIKPAVLLSVKTMGVVLLAALTVLTTGPDAPETYTQWFPSVPLTPTGHGVSVMVFGPMDTVPYGVCDQAIGVK
jgi:hypothetical protein